MLRWYIFPVGWSRITGNEMLLNVSGVKSEGQCYIPVCLAYFHYFRIIQDAEKQKS